jgi:hypothetical protein
MDVIFGSQGVAQADIERMDDINKEIGLDALVRGGIAGSGAQVDRSLEKADAVEEKEATAEPPAEQYA